MPSTRARSRILPLLCLLGAVVFWGTSFAATKTALDSFSPMTVVWLRMAIASAIFLPAWFFLPRPDYRSGDLKWLGLIVLLQPCIYYLAEGYAVRFTTSSAAGVISAIVPLLVAAGAWAFLGERLTVRSGVAIAVSLAGVAMLSMGGTTQAAAPNPVLGNVLEMIAMTSAAGAMIALKHLSTRYNPWFLTGLQAATGAVFFAPGALAGGVSSWAHAAPVAWLSVAYLGLFVSLLAFSLYNTAVTMMPANRAALSINLVPAVALLAGWLVRGESLSSLQLAACVVIVGAVVLAETGNAPERRPVVGEALLEAAVDPTPEQAAK
ncbi:MAG TPA: DMT family transporter [Coriobacteriia bacterium]|nr:DMT family transporter [Coriobacteriia bacterium]